MSWLKAGPCGHFSSGDFAAPEAGKKGWEGQLVDTNYFNSKALLGSGSDL